MSTIAVVLIVIAALAALAVIYVAVLSPEKRKATGHTPKNIDRAGPDEETARPNRPASVADRDGERRPAPAQRW